MLVTRLARRLAPWAFAGLFALLLVAWFQQDRHAREIKTRLRNECQQRYAAALTRADSLRADAWIPLPALQPSPQLQTCYDFWPKVTHP